MSGWAVKELRRVQVNDWPRHNLLSTYGSRYGYHTRASELRPIRTVRQTFEEL